MTSLPEALTPWRAWLTWFEPELAAQLGTLLQRLQPLLGPFNVRGQGGEPEWEGLDDLRTRGPYERLLATEWLLADELPDEFLRRAVSGEHIFLSPSPRRRRSQRTLVALFDAGPLQLGAPRLGHIALWILLARRAAQVQAQMRWGVLQSPGELLEASQAGHLKALLGKRSFTPPDATHLEQWRAALDADRSTTGERWLIGWPFSSLAPGKPLFTHRVHLQKDLRGEALDVSLLERGTERKVRLLLPKQESVVALLRGSFDVKLAAQPHTTADVVSLQRPPFISFDGTRVGLALRDEPAARVFFVPESPESQYRAPRQHRWSAGYGALTASLIGKAIGVLLSDAERLRFWPSSMCITPCPPQEQFHAPGSTAAWLPAAWLRDSEAQRICVIDHSRRLLRWDAKRENKHELVAEPSLQLVSEGALALAQLSKGLAAYAHYEGDRVWFSRLSTTREPEARKLMCEAPRDTVVFLGRGCLCAVRVTPDSWRITNWHDPSQSYIAHLPGDARAIGVMRDQAGRIGLLTLTGNHLRLHCHDGTNTLLYTAPTRIASHAVCPNTGLVAMLTIDRILIAFAAATQQLRICLQTGRDSHASI